MNAVSDLAPIVVGTPNVATLVRGYDTPGDDGAMLVVSDPSGNPADADGVESFAASNGLFNVILPNPGVWHLDKAGLGNTSAISNGLTRFLSLLDHVVDKGGGQIIAAPEKDYHIDADTDVGTVSDTIQVDSSRGHVIIRQPNTRLLGQGARFRGTFRFEFDGATYTNSLKAHGDRSGMLDGIVFKDWVIGSAGSGENTKAPEFNFCRNALVENISKYDATGTALNFYACEGLTARKIRIYDGLTTSIGILSHCVDDSLYEDLIVTGATGFVYGMQLKGGTGAVINKATFRDIATADFLLRLRGDSPWKPSATGVTLLTYPYDITAMVDPTDGSTFSAEWAITAVSTGSKTFTVQPGSDISAWFPTDNRFSVRGSTGNDGDYTIVSVNWSSPNLVITVSETVSSSTADGDLQNPWGAPDLRRATLDTHIYRLTGLNSDGVLLHCQEFQDAWVWGLKSTNCEVGLIARRVADASQIGYEKGFYADGVDVIGSTGGRDCVAVQGLNFGGTDYDFVGAKLTNVTAKHGDRRNLTIDYCDDIVVSDYRGIDGCQGQTANTEDSVLVTNSHRVRLRDVKETSTDAQPRFCIAVESTSDLKGTGIEGSGAADRDVYAYVKGTLSEMGYTNQTTDATPLVTFWRLDPMPEDSEVTIEAKIQAQSTDNRQGFFHIRGRFTRTGSGVPVQNGETYVDAHAPDTWSVSFQPITTMVRLNVTGEASTTINWTLTDWRAF